MFISNAYAQSQSLSSGFNMDSIGGYLPIILMFVVLYFLMIRPQQKKQKEQRNMVDALAAGDEIITSGGLLGTVTQVSENHVSMQMASGAEVFVQKAAIVGLLPKGTLGSLQPTSPDPLDQDTISTPGL